MSLRPDQIPWRWLLAAGAALALLTWSPVREHALPPDTPWHLLMQAEGLDGPSPVLPDTLRRLDAQPIRLTGFMYPLEQRRDHRRFLLSPHPAGCAFHVPSGAPGSPASTVEVFADEPVRFTYDPVAVRGTFALAAGASGGVRYQLLGARLEDPP
ncbi:MAG: DUF3299 domain-containing protein [Bacteroidota bacterium]